MTDNVSLYNGMYASIVLPNTVLMACGVVLGVVGNLTVILIYMVRIDDKRGDRYFIPVLALVDCLGSLSNGLFYILDNFYTFSFPSEALCRVLLFGLTFASGFSGHILGVIALQRYLLICRPYGKQLTLVRRRFAMIGITFVCIIYGAPLLVISGIKTSDKTFQNRTFSTNICVFDVNPTLLTLVYFGSFLLLTSANIVVTSILYILNMRTVYKTLCRENKLRKAFLKNFKKDKIHSTGKDGIFDIYKECMDRESKNRKISVESFPIDCEQSEHRSSIKSKMNVMFFSIVVFYVLSYLPPIVILILTYALSNFYYLQLPRSWLNVWIFFARFLLLNHVVNPFMYGYFDVKLRSEFKHLFCVCKSDQSDESSEFTGSLQKTNSDRTVQENHVSINRMTSAVVTG